GLETFQSVLDPLDVWRGRAGELRRPEERDLGAIMMRDACEPPRVGRANHRVEYPARPRRLDRIGHQRMPAQHARVLVRHAFRAGARRDQGDYAWHRRVTPCAVLELLRANLDIDILQLAIAVEALRAGFARAVAGLAQAPERHVRLRAE